MSGKSRSLLIVSVFFFMLILVVLSGVLDSLAHDKEIDKKRVLNSLIFYWLFCCLGILIITGWKRKWREFLLVLVSLCLVLIMVELAVRIFFPLQARMRITGVSSRKYHHLYPPNKEMFAGVYETPVIIQTNQDGLRSKYSREEFLRYRTRIVILGDSFVFGWGVAEEAAFVEVMEKMLRKRLARDDIAILNAGITSYSPFLEYLLFKGVLKEYRPNLVLLFLDVTDIGDDYKYMNEAKTDANNNHYFALSNERNVLYYGVIYELLRSHKDILLRPVMYPFRAVRHLFGADHLSESDYDYYQFRLNIDGVVENNRFFVYRHPREKTEVYFNTTFDNIKQIAAGAEKIGSGFVLVIVPRFHHWNPDECPKNWESEKYSLKEPFQYEYIQFFDEKRAEVPFDIFNLLPAFQSTKEFPLVFKGDPHWNENGHYFTAKTLVDYLLRKKCIK